MPSHDWPQPTDAPDLLRSINKRLTILERRATTSVADVVGPGIAATATEIRDWDEQSATSNGFFYSQPGAMNTPESDVGWTGTIVARDDGTGAQQVWDPTGVAVTPNWTRTFAPHPEDDSIVEFGEWRQFATHSGKIDLSELSPGVVTSIETALADAASAIEVAESGIRAFRQPTEPTEGAQGWIWYDTTDPQKVRLLVHNGTNYALPTFAMTGTTFETNAGATVGVKINTSGLFGYAPNGSVSTYLDAATGALTLLGAVVTNGDINGGTITGATVQSSATANRGVKFSNAGLLAYDSVVGSPTLGSPTFTLSSSTGAVTMKGTLLAGSTITGTSIVGSSFRTTEATTGRRLTLRQDATLGGLLEGHNGHISEVLPARLRMTSLNDIGQTVPSLTISSGQFVDSPQATLALNGGSNDIGLTAPEAVLDATLRIKDGAGLFVSGGTTLNGATRCEGRLNVVGKLDLVSNGSRAISVINFGSGAQTPNASGIITVTHGMSMGTQTYQVFLQSRNNGALRVLTLMSKNSSNFTFRVDNDTGAAVTGGTVGYEYLIVAE